MAFRALIGRLPDEVEAGILARLFEEQRALFARAPGRCGAGCSRSASRAPTGAAAAWTWRRLTMVVERDDELRRVRGGAVRRALAVQSVSRGGRVLHRMRAAGRRPVAARRPQSLRHGPRRHRARQSDQSRAGARWRRQPGPRRARRAVPRSRQGQARDLPVHGRRAVADGDVRLQAGAQPAQRRTVAGFGAPGAAADRHVGQSGVAAARRLAVRIQPPRCAAAPGSAICCRTPPKSSTTSASSVRCTPRRSITIRRSRSFRPDRRSPAGRAWARGCTTGSAATTRICRRSSC